MESVSTLEARIKEAINHQHRQVRRKFDGMKTNVNSQVAAALKEFSDKVKAGQLLVVGAV